ncbi:MAG: septum formation initiator family protein [Anaerovoracaceae bacterium]
MFKRKRRSREFKNSDKVIDIEQARAERRDRRKKALEKKQGKKHTVQEVSERKSSQKNRRRLVYGGVVLCIAAIIGVSIFKVYSLKQEYSDIIKENQALQQEKEDLREELGNVNNPEYVEEQAREQLKMVKLGEVMYILPQSDDEKTVVSTEGSMNLLPAGDEAD